MSSRSQTQEARHGPHVNPFKTDPEAFTLSDLYRVWWKPRWAFNLCKWAQPLPSWPKCTTVQKQVWPDPKKKKKRHIPILRLSVILKQQPQKYFDYEQFLCNYNNEKPNHCSFLLIWRSMIVLLKSAKISPHQQSVRKLWGLRLQPQKPAPFMPSRQDNIGQEVPL